MIAGIRGSSPCVWGQEQQQAQIQEQIRIIPMRVGTSCTSFCYRAVTQDHPHACGDKRRKSLTSPSTLGSSPCVWGQVPVQIYSLCGSRIIPMRVGTSFDHAQRQLGVWDHPHACGDKVTFFCQKNR